MRRTTIIWLIAATLLVMIGGSIFLCVMTVLEWDFSKLSTDELESRSYEIKEDFQGIFINTDTAGINFVISENMSASVECYEYSKARHAVSLRDGTLVIEVTDTRKWYDHIGIHFGSPRITVYLPAGEYGALSIKSDTGSVSVPAELSFKSIDIRESTGNVKISASAKEQIRIKASTGSITLENISADSLDLSVSTGRVTVSGADCKGNVSVEVSTGKAYLTDVSCKNIFSDGDTGDLFLKNVIASEKLSVERDTGDVSLDGCDAAEIFVETDTGDVSGVLLSEKVFITETDTGRVDVPHTDSGGICTVTTDTGDIRLKVKKGF